MPVPITPNLCAWTTIQSGLITPHVRGTFGVAKTSSVYAFCKAMDRVPYVLLGSLREPADIGGYPYPVKTAKVKVTKEKMIEQGFPEEVSSDADVFMRLVNPEWAHRMRDGRKHLLFLDEIRDVPCQVQSALLRIIMDKVVGEDPLPDDTWMMAASNPTSISTNGQEIALPLANRMPQFDWEMAWNDWDQGMNHGVSPDGDGRLRWHFPEPSFVRLPDDWWKKTSRWGMLATSFRSKGGWNQHFVTEEEDILRDRERFTGGAAPSPRAWSNLTICLASLEAIDADPILFRKAAISCIGENAAGTFFDWLKALDLPDPDLVIEIAAKRPDLDFSELLGAAMEAEEKQKPAAHRQSGRQVPHRADQIMAVLGGVNGAIAEKNSKQRCEAALSVYHKAFQAGHREQMIYRIKDLMAAQSALKKSGVACTFPKGFVDDVYPVLVKAGWSR